MFKLPATAEGRLDHVRRQLAQSVAALKVIPPGPGPTGTVAATFRLTGSIIETVLANVFEIITRLPLLLITTP